MMRQNLIEMFSSLSNCLNGIVNGILEFPEITISYRQSLF